MKITEPRTKEILNWLDDNAADHGLPYRDATALIRQLQAELQDAWHAGLDAGREQGRGKDHAHPSPSAPMGVSWADFWIAQGDLTTAGDYAAFERAKRWLRAQQPAAVDEVVRAAVLAEREACAKACDDRAAYYHAGDDGTVTRRGIACEACASVIRWRSTVSPKFLAKHEADIEERLAAQPGGSDNDH